MAAGRKNLDIEKSSDFLHEFTYRDEQDTPVNLNGFAAHLHAKEYLDQSGYTIDLHTPVNNGTGIELGGDQGTITVRIDREITKNYNFRQLYYNLDLVDPNGELIPLLEGFIFLGQRVPFNAS